MHHRKQGRQTRTSWCSELGAPTVLRKSAPGWGAANDNGSWAQLPPLPVVSPIVRKLSKLDVARARELLDELNARRGKRKRWPVFTAEPEADEDGWEDS